MVDSIPEPPSLDPSSLGSASFPRARKGFEPTQVHATLGRVADALRAWELRDQRLQERISALEAQLEAAQTFDESHMTAVLGEETMRVLSAARASAAEIRTKAEEDVARLKEETEAAAQSAAEALKKEAQTLRDEAANELAQANSESRQLRESAAAETDLLRETTATETQQLLEEAERRAAELLEQAENVLGERTAEAETRAAEILVSAETAKAEADEQAAALRDAAQVESEAVVEQAKEQGRKIIADTKALREEMLRDLAERRSLARQQIDLILSGRDQMLSVLKGAESTVAEAIADLERTLEPASDSIELTSEAATEDIAGSVTEFTELLDAQSPGAAGDQPSTDDQLGSGQPAASEASSPEEPTEDQTEERTVAATPEEEVRETSDLDLVGDVDEDVIIDLDAIKAEESNFEDDAAFEDDDIERVRLVEAQPLDREQTGDTSRTDTVTDTGNGDKEADVLLAEVDVASDVTTGATSDATTPVATELLEVNDDDNAIDEGEHSPEVEVAATATVHDLFERLRAEQGSDDDDSHDDFDDDFDDAGAIDRFGNRKPAPVVELSRVERSAPTADMSGEFEPVQTSAVGTLTHDTEPEHDGDGVVAEDEDAATAAQGITEDQALLDLRDELLAPIEKGLGRSLKRLVSDEQNVILDALRRTKKQRPSAEEILPNEEESAVAFIEALQDDFEESLAAGGAFWEQSGGTAALPLFGQEADHSDVLEVPVREFVAAHHARLAKIFADSETEALDIDEVIDRVRAVYRDTRSSTLNEVASAVAISGFTAGELDAAEPGTPCRWVLDNGGLPCPDGEDNALAGAVPAGDAFPTGHLKPPAHRGCRCIIAPIIQ